MTVLTFRLNFDEGTWHVCLLVCFFSVFGITYLLVVRDLGTKQFNNAGLQVYSLITDYLIRMTGDYLVFCVE